MADRFSKGLKIYQEGKVKLLPQKHKEFLEFEVSGKYKTEFDLKEGTVRCFNDGCRDYENRAKYAPDSFVCKHIIASFFKLAEIKGVNIIKTA